MGISGGLMISKCYQSSVKSQQAEAGRSRLIMVGFDEQEGTRSAYFRETDASDEMLISSVVLFFVRLGLAFWLVSPANRRLES